MNDAERDADSEDEENGRLPGCDPDLLDELKCKAQGIQAEADYNAAHGQELDDARAAYKAARASYNAARKEAEPQVADARRQLEELEDRVRCQLDRDDVERIDTAFGRVVERLNRCDHAHGCCCDEDCDYDDEVRDCDPDDVPGRLAVIEYRTKEAAECFWSLIGEHTVAPTTQPTPPAPAPAPASTARSRPQPPPRLLPRPPLRRRRTQLQERLLALRQPHPTLRWPPCLPGSRHCKKRSRRSRPRPPTARGIRPSSTRPCSSRDAI